MIYFLSHKDIHEVGNISFIDLLTMSHCYLVGW